MICISLDPFWQIAMITTFASTASFICALVDFFIAPAKFFATINIFSFY